MKPFQGWRYYLEEDIPKDLNLNEETDQDLPENINSELIKLGLYWLRIQLILYNKCLLV